MNNTCGVASKEWLHFMNYPMFNKRNCTLSKRQYQNISFKEIKWPTPTSPTSTTSTSSSTTTHLHSSHYLTEFNITYNSSTTTSSIFNKSNNINNNNANIVSHDSLHATTVSIIYNLIILIFIISLQSRDDKLFYT